MTWFLTALYVSAAAAELTGLLLAASDLQLRVPGWAWIDHWLFGPRIKHVTLNATVQGSATVERRVIRAQEDSVDGRLSTVERSIKDHETRISSMDVRIQEHQNALNSVESGTKRIAEDVFAAEKANTRQLRVRSLLLLLLGVFGSLAGNVLALR